ncbi:MAG: DUF488 family protein [Acidimicrobiales bacterium]
MPASPAPRSRPLRLLTVGHGTLAAGELAGLLTGAGVESLVDVRTAPGSRRHPHLGRDKMAAWLPEAGVGYRWEPRLGGWRKTVEGSVNGGLRNASFRGYADYMAEPDFLAGLDELLAGAGRQVTAAMCSETLWWRCHRRLLADAAVLLRGAEVDHLDHRGRLAPHRLTETATLVDGRVVYVPPAPSPDLPGI